MKRMHERQNIGKVILLPEPKKSEEKPKSNADGAENVEKDQAAASEKKDEAVEEVKAEKDWVREFVNYVVNTLVKFSQQEEEKEARGQKVCDCCQYSSVCFIVQYVDSAVSFWEHFFFWNKDSLFSDTLWVESFCWCNI